MAQVFDPSTIAPDFQVQNATALRQRKLADFLRANAAKMEDPEGRMVSGHYVAPNLLDYLNKPLAAGIAGYYGVQADTAENQALQSQQEAAQRWRASLPSATPEQPGVPAVPGQAATPFGLRDMPQQDATAGSPAIPGTPFKPVPVGDRLKAAMAGMTNPLTADEAKVWNTGMAEETKREDEQQSKRDNLAATLAQRAYEFKQKSEDTRFTQQQQLEFKRQQLEAQQQFHALMAQSRVDVANIAAAARQGSGSGIEQERQARREERNADKIDKQIEHIGTKMKDVAPLLVSGQAVQNMFDKYGDKVPDGLGFVGRATPTGMMPAEWAANNQAVQALVNSLVRNQAGLSQTLSETQNSKLELIVSGSATGKQFKDSWDAIRDKVNAYPKTIGASYSPEAIQIYNSRGGSLKPITSKRIATGKVTPAPGWKVEEVK
jgi:hypothetical protein